MTNKNHIPDVLSPSNSVSAAVDGDILPTAEYDTHAGITVGKRSHGVVYAESSKLAAMAAVGRLRLNIVGLTIALVLLCVTLVAALWWQRQATNQFGMAVIKRFDKLSGELSHLNRDAGEALILPQSQVGRLTALENSMRESQTKYGELEQAWRDFSEITNDGVLINDVERLVTIAGQQLYFGRSVSNAIAALELAQSRLARSNRPRLALAQQAINDDLDRLNAVPVIDVAAQTERINKLTALVSRAPLLVLDTCVHPSVAAASPHPILTQPGKSAVAGTFNIFGKISWWQRWLNEIASWPARVSHILAKEIGELIRIQRVNQPRALFLAGDQAGQLRAVLHQRLQIVQSALLMRQAPVWQSELTAISLALNDYFDSESHDTQAALRIIESLAEVQVALSLPDVNKSSNAMAAVRGEPILKIEQN